MSRPEGCSQQVRYVSCVTHVVGTYSTLNALLVHEVSIHVLPELLSPMITHFTCLSLFAMATTYVCID